MATVGGLRWMGKLGLPGLTNGQASDVGVIAGEVALDGGNPTPVVTPFKKVLAVVTPLVKSNVAPGATGLGTYISYDVSGGTVNFYAWQHTSATNPTLVANTRTDTFSYMIVGEV